MENIVGLKEFRMNVEKIRSHRPGWNAGYSDAPLKPMFRVSSTDEEIEWEKVADFTQIKKGV